MDDKLLEKLANSFDDFKERLIRIEENVKGVKDLEVSVDNQKIQIAQIDQSTKSAHHRINELEIKEKERAKEVKWLKGQIVVGFITFVFGVILYLITLLKH